MKKYFFYITSTFLVFSTPTLVFPQINQRTSVNAQLPHDKTELTLKVGNDLAEEKTLIDGKRVLGNPYLTNEWQSGIVILKNGSMYNNYKLKFDILNQILLFKSGDNAMEITDEIKEFTLINNENEFQKFINATEFQEINTRLFYQVMVDSSEKNYLKKYAKKRAKEQKSLPLSSEVDDKKNSEHFKTNIYFFLFDKKLKKITAINEKDLNLKQPSK